MNSTAAVNGIMNAFTKKAMSEFHAANQAAGGFCHTVLLFKKSSGEVPGDVAVQNTYLEIPQAYELAQTIQLDWNNAQVEREIRATIRRLPILAVSASASLRSTVCNYSWLP